MTIVKGWKKLDSPDLQKRGKGDDMNGFSGEHHQSLDNRFQLEGHSGQGVCQVSAEMKADLMGVDWIEQLPPI